MLLGTTGGIMMTSVQVVYKPEKNEGIIPFLVVSTLLQSIMQAVRGNTEPQSRPSVLKNILQQRARPVYVHRRTGLEIFGGGGRHEFARLAPKAREPLGGSGSMLPWKILKNRVSLMPFPVFSSVICSF